MIFGLHHAGLSTPDLDRLAAFYRDVIGFELAWEGGWPAGSAEIDTMLELRDVACRVAILRTGTGYLELIEFASPPPKPADPAWRLVDHGITHLCLNVADMAGEIARLTAAGVRFHGPPVGGRPAAAVYCRDPDGNVIELLEISDEGWPTHFANRRLRAAREAS